VVLLIDIISEVVLLIDIISEVVLLIDLISWVVLLIDLISGVVLLFPCGRYRQLNSILYPNYRILKSSNYLTG